MPDFTLQTRAFRINIVSLSSVVFHPSVQWTDGLGEEKLEVGERKKTGSIL